MPELIVVKASDCLPLRESVLRPGQPPEAYVYTHDEHERAFHVAMKRGQKVLAVASMLPDPRTGGPEQWRLRGMAVDPGFQKQGLGSTLLKAVLAVCEQRGGGLWCNARTTAEPFYVAHGFTRLGDVFEIPGGGPHVVMNWYPPDRPRPVDEDAVVEEGEDALDEA